MSVEQNKAVARKVYDILINQSNRSIIDELYMQDVIVHDPFMGTHQGIDAFRALIGLFDSAFPGHTATVQAMIGEGDLVSVMHTHYAKHTGDFMGLPGTGKEVVVGGIETFRLRDGKIAEFWRNDDDAGLLMQLGIVPAPAQAA
jgi:steroid delta-isomerase-like uncharacterized protein